MTDNLRDRIAAVIHDYSVPIPMAKLVADAVIRELDLGIPCATTGCRMRQIARRHTETSCGLTDRMDNIVTDENAEPAVSKTGSVRDRIAEVLCEDGQRPMHTAMRLADAVIAELGLSREWGQLDPTDSGAIYDTLEDALAAIDLPNETLRTRLVTEWHDV